MDKHAPATFWTEREIQLLENFLLREDGPEETMDVSMLDGFLCAVVSGPKLIMPGEMMRWIWDCERGVDEPVFDSAEQANEIMQIVMRQWNDINEALTHSPADYEPLILERPGDDGQPVPVIDEWCMGYYKGMDLDFMGWSPLMVGQPALLSPILKYGTAEGWEILKKKPLSLAEHRAVADTLGDVARRAHAFWLAQRRERQAEGRPPSPVYRRETVRREGPKIGRNDPCPCGSGRKYKQCHGAN